MIVSCYIYLCIEQDIANLVKLTRSTGNRLLFDVNLQLRFGQQWDPSNAIELFEFCASQGFCDDIDWELGNGWLWNEFFTVLVLWMYLLWQYEVDAPENLALIWSTITFLIFGVEIFLKHNSEANLSVNLKL